MKNIRLYLAKEWILIPALIIWASVILINYHHYHPFLYEKTHPLFAPLVLTSFAILFLLISFGTGYRIFRLFKINNISLLETFLFSTGIGFGILMYLTFLMGVIGGLYHSLIYVLFVILGLFAIPEIINFCHLLKESKMTAKKFKGNNSFFDNGLKIILIFLFLVSFFCGTYA